MENDRFDGLARSMSAASSRRGFGRVLAGGGLGALSGASVTGLNVDAKRKHGKKRTKKRRRGRGTGSATTPPPPLGPVLTYQCSAPGLRNPGSGSIRFAQTFTAERSGPLRQIQFSVDKPAGTTSDYVVQLLEVVGGKPSHSAIDVLVSVTVPDADVATSSDTTVTATFNGPALVAGTEYAAAFSRPGSGLGGAVPYITLGDSTCSGKLFVADGAGPFNEAFNQDLLVSVRVG